MSNSTVNLALKPYGKGGRPVILPVDAGSHLYSGTMVAQLTGTAMLVPGSTASSGPCIGVATHEQDATVGSDGDKRAAIITDGVFIFANGLTSDACSEATLFGSPVYMHDDHTVYDNDAGGTLERAGFFVGMEPDGTVRVYIPMAVGGFGAVSVDPGALTFTAVAGTANQTLEAMADPTDTPATADALRDDIVANLLPKVRNNFADVATQLNAIRTALINAGLMA